MPGRTKSSSPLADASIARLQENARRARDELHCRLYDSLYDSQSEAFVMVDMAGGLLEFTPAYEKMLGYSAEELLDLTYVDLTPEKWHALEARIVAEQVLPLGQSEVYQKEYIRKDGSVLPVELRTFLLRDAEGQPELMWAIVRDISERRRGEQELIAARAAAEQANRAKSRFLAAASHDLRQPLAALSLYVGLLKNRGTPPNGDLAGKIHECVDSLSEMLTDLLDVSKLDAGLVEPKASDFDVDELLNSVASVHAAEAQLKGLCLRLRYCGAPAHTDRRLLQRILGTLVDNAIRYTEQGGVLIAARRRRGRFWIEVWDTGIGIAEDQNEIIFEEFRQLGDGARNRGSGLGLAIAAKAAALLGLAIRVRSRPGRGSMFAIELPVGRSSGALPAAAARHPAGGLRIALVDDNPMVLEALARALEASGHQVIAAASGQELMDRLGPKMPDIVVSDYRLAQAETGYEVIDAVRRAFGPELPALLITGDTDPQLLRSMADRGIAVQHKPLQIDALLAFIGAATRDELHGAR